MPEDTSKSPQIKLNVPPEMRHGVYANHMVAQFITPFEFQLNFAYLLTPSPGENDIEADIVAKINVPTSLMPSLIRALEENYRKFIGKVKEAETKNENTDE